MYERNENRRKARKKEVDGKREESSTGEVVYIKNGLGNKGWSYGQAERGKRARTNEPDKGFR